jgi:hypothetical protein
MAALNEDVKDASISLLLIVCPNIQTIIYYEPENIFSTFSNTLTTIVKDSRSGVGGVYLSKLQTVKHMIGERYHLLSSFNLMQLYPYSHQHSLTSPDRDSCIARSAYW